MSTTIFMNLELPTPTVTPGPEWASAQNTAFELVDSHDHSVGKGVKITPSGLNLDADLDLQSNKVYALKSTQYDNQVLTLTGASNARSVYSYQNNLYWTNGSGVAVQITDGSSVVSVPSTVQAWQYNSFSTDVTISGADPYVFLSMDCSAPRVVTLPAASSVAPGRFYLIKDATSQSETNTLSLQVTGADTIDGAAFYDVKSDGALIAVTTNGLDTWFIS